MNEYYTVSQYADAFGKDPGNIRRLLISGDLEGEKVGNQWLIPKNAKYPEDRRVKSGDYHNWRQKVRLNGKYPKLLKTLNGMCEKLGEMYSDNMSEVILYGSYVRGTETDESDIDVAIILNGNQTEEQHDKMTDIVVDYELNLGVTLSVISIERSHFMEWKEVLPFYKNIEKEGVVLWKSE